MKKENQEIIMNEVRRILPRLDHEGDVTIVIFVDHDCKVDADGDTESWMREQVFSYLCETNDNRFIVDDAVHTDSRIDGKMGTSTVCTVTSLRP